MKKQLGGALAVVLCTLGVIGVLVGIAVTLFMSANNTANAFEQKVKYSHENNKNILAQYQQKILEVVQVPEMMRDDLVKVATAAIEGRYGHNGSQAVVQVLQEQNPTLDPVLYRKAQQLVESGRDEFKGAQTKMLDVKRSYETALGSFPQGFIMKVMGYPKVDLEKYNIVINDGAAKAFETGREAPMQLRSKQP